PNLALSTQDRIVGEGRNSADFINTYLDIPITGLNLNNIAILATLAILLILSAVLAVRSRKKKESIPLV
ncbi:MAG: hypothetical protein FWC86_01050, partial [Coriobacteriia bacterium]|nr:hypothetical protein [Coriobacteriia bacterium]